MKIFITVELDKRDIIEPTFPSDVYEKLQEVMNELRREGIYLQYKVTNLPRSE